ncbi:hypothetical protein Glove_208g175 [Diversispora epigaea]|uniref:Uncharacterized protein n=1 Tax=Diversispora epigaea TaxID=1348612 RepID=A0A397INU0_9GLOM|nr:hypothetical protein Glove_208g175 [Diversispora epigaea]
MDKTTHHIKNHKNDLSSKKKLFGELTSTMHSSSGDNVLQETTVSTENKERNNILSETMESDEQDLFDDLSSNKILSIEHIRLMVRAQKQNFQQNTWSKYQRAPSDIKVNRKSHTPKIIRSTQINDIDNLKSKSFRNNFNSASVKNVKKGKHIQDTQEKLYPDSDDIHSYIPKFNKFDAKECRYGQKQVNEEDMHRKNKENFRKKQKGRQSVGQSTLMDYRDSDNKFAKRWENMNPRDINWQKKAEQSGTSAETASIPFTEVVKERLIPLPISTGSKNLRNIPQNIGLNRRELAQIDESQMESTFKVRDWLKNFQEYDNSHFLDGDDGDDGDDDDDLLESISSDEDQSSNEVSTDLEASTVCDSKILLTLLEEIKKIKIKPKLNDNMETEHCKRTLEVMQKIVADLIVKQQDITVREKKTDENRIIIENFLNTLVDKNSQGIIDPFSHSLDPNSLHDPDSEYESFDDLSRKIKKSKDRLNKLERQLIQKEKQLQLTLKIAQNLVDKKLTLLEWERGLKKHEKNVNALVNKISSNKDISFMNKFREKKEKPEKQQVVESRDHELCCRSSHDFSESDWERLIIRSTESDSEECLMSPTIPSNQKYQKYDYDIMTQQKEQKEQKDQEFSAQDNISKSDEFGVSIDDNAYINNKNSKFLDDERNQSSQISSLDCILSQMLKMNTSEIGDYELNSEYLKSYSDDINQDISDDEILQDNTFEGNNNLFHKGTSFENEEINTVYKWKQLVGLDKSDETKSNNNNSNSCTHTTILNESKSIDYNYDNIGNPLLFDDYRSCLSSNFKPTRQSDEKSHQELPVENIIICSNKTNNIIEQPISVENSSINSSSSSVNKDKDKFFSILWSIIDNDSKQPIQIENNDSSIRLSLTNKDSKDNKDDNNLKSQEQVVDGNMKDFSIQSYQNEEDHNLDSPFWSTTENGLYFPEVVNNLPSWKSFVAYVRGDVDRK